jgi:hypothetical protein
MGVKTSPYIFQRNMYGLLGHILNIQVYLDDIIITSNGRFEKHAAIMEKSQKDYNKHMLEKIYANVMLVQPKLII